MIARTHKIRYGNSQLETKKVSDARIYRPIELPAELRNKPALCNLFNARGVLVIKAGAAIPALALDPQWPVRLFCEAHDAHLFSDLDPEHRLRQISDRLSALSARVVLGEHVSQGDLLALTHQLHELWALDADACLGLARLLPQDKPSARHALHVALLGAELAAAQGLESSQILSIIGSALTMHLSTLALHDEMYHLHGKPNEAKRLAIRRHPSEGVDCLQRIGRFASDWIQGVAAHHENLDGSGYPQGLQRGAIPLAARMVRVSDTLAARLTGRKLRRPQHWNILYARDTSHLVRHIFASDLKRLDQALANRQIQALTRFPPGSLVRLSNGELALTTRRVSGQIMPRQVLSVIDANGRAYDQPQPRRLSPQTCTIRSYAHDLQRTLPAYDWKMAWGYGLPAAQD